jgi:hypothetical protein
MDPKKFFAELTLRNVYKIAREILGNYCGQSKPDGVGAVSQRLIPTGEQSGLLTHTGMTESVSLCVRQQNRQKYRCADDSAYRD